VHTCPARAARTCWQSDETSPEEILERIRTIDCREPSDRPAATGDHDLGALLDALEMLAQPVVKLTHPNLVSPGR
jgi:hypothetical protein